MPADIAHIAFVAVLMMAVVIFCRHSSLDRCSISLYPFGLSCELPAAATISSRLKKQAVKHEHASLDEGRRC